MTMYAVVTRVKLLPGSMDDFASTFRATHPPLTEHEMEWRSVRLLADRATDVAMIVELWHSADAYRRFASGGAFRSAMSQLERYFDGTPEVSVTEVLADLEREGGAAQGIAFGPA